MVGGEGSLCEVNEISVGLVVVEVEKEVGWCLYEVNASSLRMRTFFSPRSRRDLQGRWMKRFFKSTIFIS